MPLGKPFQVFWPLDWSLRDAAALVAASIVVGGVFFLWEWVFQLLARIAGEEPTGLFYAGLLYGVWHWGGLLLAYIIRKPGAALVGEVGAALISYVLPSPLGVRILVLGWVQGIALELAFAWAGFTVWSLPVMLAAGAQAGVASFAINLVAPPFQLIRQSGGTVIGMLITMVISGAVLGGWVCRILGDRVLAIPAVRRFLGTETP